MLRNITRLWPLFLLVCVYPGNVGAQQSHSPDLNLGDAVVTGFSGTLPPARGKSAIDRTFINPDGPSARVIALGRPGYVWDGRLFAAPKPFDVLAKDVGQVFGVALDDASPSNIYLAATSVFGLNMVRRDHDGQPERRKKGGPGVVWMKGQFGLELQGGPGSIYKVDGRTGAVTLFADVTLNGVPNPAPGLGNLAYDSAHKQLFVSDLYTGMIHRFALDGKELGAYDHGMTALTAAKLAAVAFDPKKRPNIASERFNSEDPDTWGYAPAARRVWALAVHDGRLFYSARNGASDAGPQIWSVGIAKDGDFASDARWELDVPAKPGPYRVSDIAFTHGGAMILAQRAPSTGAYNYVALTHSGEPRVLRYRLESPDDPKTPSRWIALPDEYAIGLADDDRNGNGGVALGYGYGPDGVLRTDTCEAALWSTGQNLRNSPAMRRQLEPGGPLAVNGLQGSPADMVRNANTPPMLSYFIDYDGKFDDASARGHMGSVRILNQPCTGSTVARRAAPANAIQINMRPHACTPTCVCPPGTELKGRECVKVDRCPPPQVMIPGVGCRCPNGNPPIDGLCRGNPKSDITCKPPMIQIQGGPCVCPDGTTLVDGQCLPNPRKCPPPLVPGPRGTCICPQGSVMHDGKCVPQVCPPPMVPGPCVEGTPIDLGVEKTGKTSPPVDVPWYSFQITVTNHGPGSAAAGTITVTDTIPNGMTFTNVAGSNWLCSPTGGGPGTLITCTYNLATNAGDVLPPIDITAQAIGKGPFPPFTNCAVVAPASGSDLTDTDSSNNQACVTVSKPGRTGDLTVKKTVRSNSPIALPPMTFPIDVTCGSSVTHMNLPNGGTQTVTNTPLNTSCAVVEGTIVTPPNACPPRMMPVWSTTYTPLSPINVTGSGATMLITNILDCKPAIICTPPQVMIPGVGCRCPDGEVLVNGKCVTPIVCKSPLVPNATNNECVCPDHEVLRRGKCVEVEKPKHHTCKRGYIWDGDTCVRRESEPRDDRRELPGRLPGGSFPRGGGGGTGSGKR